MITRSTAVLLAAEIAADQGAQACLDLVLSEQTTEAVTEAYEHFAEALMLIFDMEKL